MKLPLAQPSVLLPAWGLVGGGGALVGVIPGYVCMKGCGHACVVGVEG